MHNHTPGAGATLASGPDGTKEDRSQCEFQIRAGCNNHRVVATKLNMPQSIAISPDGATAYIAGYSTGFGGDPSRARLVASVFRQRPIYLTAGTNYFGFDLAFLMGNAPCCPGCETGAEIVWSAGYFYDSTGASVVVSGPGLLGDCVAVNGPGCFVRLSSATPDPLEQRAPMPSRSGIGCPTAAIGRTWGMIKQIYR